MRLMRGVSGCSAGWLVLVSLWPLSIAQAEELPLWELGIGTAGLSMPNYRGSDERTGYLLAFPYVVYNGSRFKLDREGLRGDLFRSDRVTLDVSIGAGTPARSGAGARDGMPDLDSTVEAGPAIRIDLDEDGAEGRWALVLPVRGVIATDFRHTQPLGWLFAPYLQYEVPEWAPGWRLNISGGPMYVSERYHDYYYEIDTKFATSERPAYDARGGYSGSRLTVTLSKRYKDYWLGIFARYDDLSGAAFEDSPLVRTDHSLMLGLGVAWVFARSAVTVPESSDAP